MSGVFLSYARADDEPYVRSLYNHLHAAGFDAWFDREHMPSRSLTFLQEIRDAIRKRDRLVIVLGPEAIKSDYVRAEWQAALVEGKAVTPILRLGDYDIVPPELKNLHCPDVRETRPVAAALAEVIRILNEPVPPLAELAGAIPAVPPHFQPRPDDLSQIARSILFEVENPVVVDPPQRTTVLHGMGGAGKSVLAAAFARATTTRRVFGDGILWIQLTTSTSPLEVVRSVLTAAGQPIATSSGINEATTSLRQWLSQRRCLIVLDNVWAVDQIASITQALSPVSRLLVTARDAGIATSLGAISQSVDALSLSAALVQLADWVGLSVEDLPPDAHLVAEQCGGLPFALALQGALAHDGVPWSDLLDALRDADLTFAQQQLPDYPYLDVLNVIQASVDMLRAKDENAAARFLELGAFFWNEGVATSALIAFWKSVAKVEARDARRLLVELQRKALIRVAGTPPVAFVHDLVADYLTASNDVSKLQELLLNHYRAQCADGWATGPDDGYFHRHLIDHLAALTDDRKEANELLGASTPDGKNAWFEASDRTGNIDAYRRQLERLINAPSAGLSAVITHALKIASVNSLAGNLPVSLAAALVRAGIWTIQQGSGYARQCSDAKQRAVGLAALLELAQDQLRLQLFDEALSAARSIEEFPAELRPLLDALVRDGRTSEALSLARRAGHGDNKVGALVTIAGHLAGAEREVLIDEAMEVCATTMDLFRAAAVELLLPLLDVDGLKALDAAAIAPLDNAVARGWCEVPFVKRLLELNDVEAAWTRTQNVSDVLSRATAIASCISHLPPNDREAAVDNVVNTICETDIETTLDDVYDNFSHLPKFLSDILPMIMQDRPLLLEPIQSITPYLNGPNLSKIIELLQNTTDLTFAAEGIATLAPVIAAGTLEDLIAKVLPVIKKAPDEGRRMRAFASLLRVTANDRHQELLKIAFDDVHALSRSRQLAALKNLAPALKANEIDAALLVVGQSGEATDRAECIEAMIPAATKDQLRSARSVVMKIGDEREALFAAAALSANLDADQRRDLLERALQQPDYSQARIIALLAPQLDDESLEIALKAVARIDDGASQAEAALPALARRAPEPQRRQILQNAIDIAARMTDAERRVWALEAMIDQFDPPLRDLAFTRFNDEAANISDEWRAFGQGLFLGVIAPTMPEPKRTELLDEALALVPQLEESSLRRVVLSGLAKHLDLERWTTVIEIVEAENDAYERAIMAGFLIGDAPAQLRPRLVEAALAQIEEIALADYGLMGDGAEAASARVLAYSANPVLALDVIGRFKDEGWKRAALLQYARTNVVDVLDPLLVQINNMSRPRERATVKLALAGQLNNPQRQQFVKDALSDALDEPADLLHDDLFPDLARKLCELSTDRLHDLFRAIAPRLADRDRSQMLTLIHGLAPMFVRLELGAPTVNAIFAAQRWWP
jgi:hypothetical protein